jgi:hypothetical protein
MLMTGTHKGARMLKATEPEATIVALARRAERLCEDINTFLDALVRQDKEQCPNLPEQMIRNMRLAPFFHRTCLCAWLKGEHASCCKDEP